jgi:protein-arginine deiminase
VNLTSNWLCGQGDPDPEPGVDPEPDIDPHPGDPVADLDVDTNRDGAITEADDEGEATFSSSRGATFLANWDDDNNNGERDGQEDYAVNGTADLDDLARLIVRQADVGAGEQVQIVVAPQAAAQRTNIFLLNGNNAEVIKTAQQTQGTISTSAVLGGDVTLGIEATTGIGTTWDGVANITLRIRSNGQTLSSDTVQMHVSPVILPTNLEPPERLFVMRITGGQDENSGLWLPLQSELPQSVELYNVSQGTYDYDRWLQDTMQTGYTSMADGSAAGHEMKVHVQLYRPRGLQNLLPGELLGPNVGYAFPGGPNDTSHNYGGNLEVFPPYVAGGTSWPFGRLLKGGGDAGSVLGAPNTDRMAPTQAAWLDAQQIQGPALELSSEWLIVGHLDEIFLVVPDHRPNQARPYKIALASPALAREILLDVQAEGAGSTPVFQGRGQYQRSVNNLLNDDELMTYNDAVQARIDSIVDVLSDAMDLAPSDFIEVPVLYEAEYYFGGLDLSIALNPGIQNLIVIDDTLFTPDPEGPNVGGVDRWRQPVTAGLSPLGNNVEFVDVFFSYHTLSGEAHCGSNVERSAMTGTWYEDGGF